MNIKFIFIICLLFAFSSRIPAQIVPSFSADYSTAPTSDYAPFFAEAYQLYPNIPKGILEAVAYTRTHMRHLNPVEEAPSCIGLPAQYGIMGLVMDGENYFESNGLLVASLAPYTVEQITSSARFNILAYAATYNHVLLENQISKKTVSAQLPVLIQLSELPSLSNSENILQDNYAIQTQIYGILDFLKQDKNQTTYDFPNHYIDLETIFGQQNYKVLSSPHVLISESSIATPSGDQFDGNKSLFSVDYPPALWVAAAFLQL